MTKPTFIRVRTACIPTNGWAWFKADGPGDDNPEGKIIHGPFASREACDADVRSVLGPDYDRFEGH